MKKASVAWETIIKLIIALVVFIILISLVFLFKERIFDLFYAFKYALGFRGP